MQMKIQFIILLLFLVFPFRVAQAAETEVKNNQTWQYYGSLQTTFPLLVGAGVGVNFGEQFDFGLYYGVTPQPYYNIIADFASSQSGNASYKNVINAAFQNNSNLKASFQYFFNNSRSGWRIGANYTYLTSSGAADIDQVLAAATGQNYTALKSLLIALGRPTQVDMTAKINILEIESGYSWALSSGFILRATFGIAKVVSNQVSLKSGLANFEATVAGSNLMRQSESGIQDIINQYGISPTLGINLNYFF